MIGYITTRPQPDASIGQIPNMAVDTRYRRRGVASSLIEHALDYLRSCGMRVAKIETLVQNAQGQTLYPRFGFQGSGPPDPLRAAAGRRLSGS